MAEDATLGSALIIPESALSKIREADDKIKALQDTAKATAASVTQSFNGMTAGTQGFIQALDQIVSKLGTINTSASNAGSGLSNLGGGIGNVGSGASKAAQDVVDLVNRLSSIKGAGTSGIMQAAAAFERLQESMKGKSGMNIAELKASISEIEKQLKDTENLLTKSEQDALVKRRAVLRDELADQQRTYNERVIAFQQALDRMARAEQTYDNKQKKSYAAQSKDYQAQNFQKNTTYQGALDFSSTANTLARQAKAVEYLKEARLKLSTADANYKQKLEALNEAIKKHSQVLKEAGVNSAALAEKTSYMSGYISRWAQRMAFAFSVGSITSFANQIANVRGQFELSQRSLESILQNKSKADEIFNKTVELAVKSPFQIKDLVDYTRQLSAYRIESDKLYDTTKRLADVSAGLGVDMGRLILAYGQVKAAAYLRGSEVRQFTEAGINMYGELQDYFKEVKGEAYTTAQIVDMISKKMVTFEDVEAIFQRMTDKGGTFYNMQEIQAETLQGKIANLKDAFDVMLNDIGKSNESMIKGMVGWTTSMLDNWQAIATAGQALLAVIVSVKLHSALMKTSLAKAFLVDAAMVGKWQAFLNVFRAMPTVIGKVKTAIVAMGGAIKAALGGLAVFAAFQIAWDVAQSISDCNKKIKEAKEESLKTKGEIGALAGAYDNLAKAASNAGDKMKGEDLEKNIADRRTQLQKLIDLAEKDGLTFKINVEALDEKQLDAAFNRVKKEYTKFVDDIELIRTRYAKNQVWDNWFTDGLNDNAEDYKDAVVEALGQSAALERVVATINAGYKNATKETKAYYDEIRAGQKENESNIDYMTRTVELIKKINASQKVGSAYMLPRAFKGAQVDFSNVIRALGEVSDKANDLTKDFDSVFGDLKTKYNNDPIKIQAAIDKIAAENDWNQYERDLAYRHFGINIYVKKAEMEKEISWIDDYISGFFAKRKYGVNIVLKNISNEDALGDFIKKGDDAAKAARNYAEVEKRLLAVAKNAKEIKVDDSIRKLFKAGDPRIGGDTIAVETLRSMLKEYKNAAADTAKNAYGVDSSPKESKGTAKQQRDILQERINLLKDMNSKYNELLKTESAEQALAKTRTYFKEAAQNVGWKASEIFPDDASVAKRVRELAAAAKDVAKKGNYLRTAADIEWNISKEEYDKLKTEVSRNVEDAFSGLELYKKLKDTGLSDAFIKNQFGDLASSFEEVKKQIDAAYNQYITRDYEEKYGKDRSKWSGDTQSRYNADMNNTQPVLESRFKGSDILKEYQEQNRKLGEQVYKDQVSQAQELLKAYKTQLTDQLELDRWYIEEREKIMNNQYLDNDTKDELTKNLTQQRDQKHDENEWNQFQNTDMYVSMFENLDHTSSRMLNNMKSKLESLRSSLKNLSPEQLKQVATQMEKIDEQMVSRDPYKKLGSTFTQYIKFAKERKTLETEYLASQEKEEQLKDTADTKKAEFEDAKEAYDIACAKYGVESEEAQQAKKTLDTAREISNAASDQYVKQQGITKEYSNQIKNGEKLEKTLQNSLRGIGSDISSVTSFVQEGVDMLNAWGANIKLSEDAQAIVGGFDKVGSSLESIDITHPFTAIKGVVGILTGLGQAVGGIFGWSSKDSKLQAQIEEHQKVIERLQTAYEELKEKMNEAWDMTSLVYYSNQTKENLEQQNAQLEAMIAAEKGKKDSDGDAIEQWQKQIEANKKAIKEAEEELTESLGGLGSESNYKAAAQEFADAWVDAFNEGSDTLEALNEQVNDLVTNLMKKQLMLRGAKKILEPLFKAIDQAVDEGSDEGYNVSKEELAKIKDLGETSAKTLNEYYSGMAEVLGMMPTSASSNLSDLQQGIQSVTESTASALESLLNSIRYYLSLQRTDVSSILSILQTQNGSTQSSANPQLEELKMQTAYLKQIAGNWDSVLKSNHTKGGFGLKVFLD